MSQVEIAQRSIRGSFALFAGNFLSTIVSFVVILFIARLLGPSNYGVYTLCVLLPNFLLNFLGFGVSSGITRYAAYHLSQGQPDDARRMTMTGAIFIMLFGTALSVLDFLIAGFVATSVFNRPEIAPLLRFSSVFILAQAVFQSGTAALLGWSYMGKIGITTIAQSVLRLAIVAPLLLAGYEVYGALVAYAASVVLGGLLAYALLWRGMRGTGYSLSGFGRDVATLLSYGRELFVGALAANFSAQYVVAILAIIASNAYVGYYQSASNFVTAITLTSGAITQALFPAFAHLGGAGSDVSRAFRLAVKYMGFAVTPIIFLLMGASLQVIRLPLGPSYSSAAVLLTLLAFSNVSMLFGTGVLPSFFNGLGRTRYYMLSSVAGAGVVLALAPALSVVGGLGVYGLIFSILAANMVVVATGLYLASRYMNAHVDFRACASILVSSLLAYAATVGVSMVRAGDYILLPAEVVVFAAVYLTLAPVAGALDGEDLDILSDALSGLGRFEVVISPVVRYERFILRVAGRSPLAGSGDLASSQANS
ncbi:MAG: oligosaccharide flippase family protein [Nitrososphaerota archaeon]|nr:oligosaccharide flippase family protein [Nitrososphaerota archaeon]